MTEQMPTNEFCREGRALEKMAAGVPLPAEEKERLDRHLSQCAQCQKALIAVRRQYDLIRQELHRPVHNKVLDLAKYLSSSQVEYGLLVCRPISPTKPASQTGLFFTELLFYANGTRFGDKECLADFEELQDCLAIRAMSDLKDHKLLLYLWQPDCESFSGWKLKLDGQVVDVAEDGKAAISLCGIKELHGKVVQIERGAESA